MIRSMTAFGTAQGTVGNWRVSWDLRAVNHRYLDLGLRLPDPLRGLELAVRNRIGESFKRGRVDCTLTWKPLAPETGPTRIDMALVRDLLDALHHIEALEDRSWAGFSAIELLRWPGVMQETEPDLATLEPGILAVLDRALAEALAFREREGAQIAALLDLRCTDILSAVGTVRERLPAVLAGLRDKLRARLAEVTTEPDVSRLEQELVYFAQKMDVTEELDRLTAHTTEVRHILTQWEPAGRRLDFLIQEMNREANTLASKSADLETTRAAVDIKVLIEQMREQVQNVE
ncbi:MULTISPECIES: YicC/YloC family endoribonuclease [Methylococcus]|uniref:YicC family protein n=1 Tax=Methylococcus capsulatus TaxID=414 RepID=A0ABZ2F9M1_METCP|nr:MULTISPECIES: YicC/YloC family endoribonuclease [Methylococcus]MDF9392891.1 YicC family protein [Methylococcus capsulatus]